MILRWSSRTYLRGILPLLLVAAAAGDARAQTLRGRLVDAQTAAPIASAFVILRDSSGIRILSFLADSIGRFQIAAQRGGHYTVRIERLGYRTFESEPFLLEGDSVVVKQFSLPQEAIALPAVQAASTRRCTGRRDLAEAAAAIWEELRKALSVADWTSASGQIQYDVRQYEKFLDARLRGRRDSTVSIGRQTSDGSPFRSVSITRLMEGGFIQRGLGAWDYYGPDAGVLLADEFLDRHCFRATPHPNDRNLVGLQFEPSHESGLTDIEGTLWLDRGSYELRHVEFRYTALPWDVSAENSGGRVDFLRLPDGRIIVSRWWLRAPNVAPTRRTATSRPRDTIVQYHEIGHEVLRAFDAAGAPIPLRRDQSREP